MLPGTDIPGMSSSLGARRAAASNLPALTELPPPPIAQLHNKYQAYGALNSGAQQSMSANSVTSLGNLLTPPNSVPGDSSNSSNMPSSAPPAYGSFQQQQANNFWNNTLPSGAQYGPYHSGAQQSQWIPPRGMFSPTSLDSLVRGSSGMMQSQPYELTQLPPFNSSLSMAAPITLPAMVASQQIQNMNNAYMGSQPATSGPSHASPMSAQEQFVSRPHLTPSYFSQAQSTPNIHSPTNFPFSNTHPPAHSSSVSPATNVNLMSDNALSRTTSLPTTSSQSSSIYSRPSYGSYNSPPSMSNTMMSNMNGAQGQMAMMGNVSSGMSSYNNGHSTALHSLYNNQHSHQSTHQNQQQQHHQQQTTQHHTPQHPTPTDRPFKCDSCPQSFNRNHDLKRHKRIHLAVKPYPCGHCDKSFSRKDALKRHILVKGCGKAGHDSHASSDSKSESISPTTIPMLNPMLTQSE